MTTICLSDLIENLGVSMCKGTGSSEQFDDFFWEMSNIDSNLDLGNYIKEVVI